MSTVIREIGTAAGGKAAAVAAFTAKVIAQLKLNPQQQAAFLAYEDLIAETSRQTPFDPDAYRAMTLPQKLDYMGDQATHYVTMLRARANGARRLYELLSVDQRKALDAIIFPPQASVAPSTIELPAPADYNDQLPSHTNPDWLVRPTESDISRVFPRAARDRHIVGSALLHCVVDTDGYLSDCTISDETPKDAGFGNAALEVTAYMRMKPATTYGVPVESKVNVPINFQF